MEFIGDGKAQPILKDDKEALKDIKEIFIQTIENLHKLVYKARLVHADLSEFNMIYLKKKLYFIDMGQTVALEHIHSREFYDRDVRNLVKFFGKHGIEVSEERFKEMVKSNDTKI